MSAVPSRKKFRRKAKKKEFSCQFRQGQGLFPKRKKNKSKLGQVYVCIQRKNYKTIFKKSADIPNVNPEVLKCPKNVLEQR